MCMLLLRKGLGFARWKQIMGDMGSSLSVSFSCEGIWDLWITLTQADLFLRGRYRETATQFENLST